MFSDCGFCTARKLTKANCPSQFAEKLTCQIEVAMADPAFLVVMGKEPITNELLKRIMGRPNALTGLGSSHPAGWFSDEIINAWVGLQEYRQHQRWMNAQLQAKKENCPALHGLKIETLSSFYHKQFFSQESNHPGSKFSGFEKLGCRPAHGWPKVGDLCLPSSDFLGL